MRILLYAVLLTFICIRSEAQTFEGILQINYKSLSGSRNAVDVYVKGDRFYIKKVYGGCDRYDSYIYDVGTHTLTCLSPQSPKTALSLDIDKVLDIFKTKHLKPAFKTHISHPYEPTSSTKKIAGINCIQKKAIDQDTTYEIWTTDLKLNYRSLIPMLRVTGFWGDAEDGNNTILEAKIAIKNTSKASTINVTPIPIKVGDDLFVIPQDYQQVNLDKFLVNEYKSPRFGELVKAFTGF